MTFEGGEIYWDRDKKGKPQLPVPFPGPFIQNSWVTGFCISGDYDDFTQKQIIDLVDRVWNLKNSFSVICEKASALLAGY